MSRWSGYVGYSKDVEEPTGSGIYLPSIVEKKYYGDLLSNFRKNSNSSSLNDNLTLSNKISIVADDYAFSNYLTIKYVTLNGIRWKVDSIEIIRPRMMLSISEVYNKNEQ